MYFMRTCSCKRGKSTAFRRRSAATMFRLLYLRDAAAGSPGYSQSFRLSKQDPLFGGRRVEAFSRAAAREGARSVWRFLRDGEDPSTQGINARKVVRGEVRSRSSRETKEVEFRLWRDGERKGFRRRQVPDGCEVPLPRSGRDTRRARKSKAGFEGGREVWEGCGTYLGMEGGQTLGCYIGRQMEGVSFDRSNPTGHLTAASAWQDRRPALQFGFLLGLHVVSV